MADLRRDAGIREMAAGQLQRPCRHFHLASLATAPFIEKDKVRAFSCHGLGLDSTIPPRVIETAAG
jgi:hypothetical protein